MTEDQRDEITCELKRLNTELVGYVDNAIRTAFAEYRDARRVGLGLLALAAICWASQR